jgi:hypothetical protein
MSVLRPKDGTRPWNGAYQPYDLIKEACIAIGVIGLLAVVLAVLFSSPDEKPSTITQWSRQLPVDFVKTAATELDGTSGTATYGPPYNHESGSVQHFLFLHPQRWLGVSHPIDTAQDYVIGPLETVPDDPELQRALAEYRAAPGRTQKAWGEAYAKPLEEDAEAEEEGKPLPKTVTVDPATGMVSVQASGTGPVPRMMTSLLALARSGGVDGSLLTSSQFFQTDYTKPLLFMADGGLLDKRAEEQHLGGDEWGMMNETGSYPGQAWLWQELTQRGHPGDADHGRPQPRAHLHPVHPRRARPAPQDPDLQADLARALPRDQAALQRVAHEIGAGGEPELLLDVRAVRLDGAH